MAFISLLAAGEGELSLTRMILAAAATLVNTLMNHDLFVQKR